MAIEVVTSSIMTSDVTPHIARCVGDDRWVVSWLPGRTLTGLQAVAAMRVATQVATAVGPLPDTRSELDELAGQLGLTGREAAFLISVENRDYRHPSAADWLVSESDTDHDGRLAG